jgi:hypothetical protein
VHTNNRIVTSLLTAGAMLAAAGCQGAGLSASVPTGSDANVSSRATASAQPNELLYTSTLDWDSGTGQVYAYPAYGTNTKPVDELDIKTGFPEGLWTDSKGDVYIAIVNAGPTGAGYVAEYSPGLKKQVRSYDTGLEGPSAGTFDSAGNMYVTNLCSRNSYSCGVFAPAGGPQGHRLMRAATHPQDVYGYVSIFAPGSTTPSSYLYPPITNLIGVTIDSSGNAFTIDLMGDPVASEFHAGSTQPKTVPFKGLPSQPTIMGVTTDPAGALVIAINQNIDFFPKEKGKPAKSLSGMVVPWGLAYGSDGTLFAGNYEFENNEGNTVAFPPGSNKPARTYAVPYNNGVTGVAVGKSN